MMRGYKELEERRKARLKIREEIIANTMQKFKISREAAINKMIEEVKARQKERASKIVQQLFEHAKENHISNIMLALLVGVSWREVYRWRSGKHYPTSAAIIEKILAVIGLKRCKKLGF